LNLEDLHDAIASLLSQVSLDDHFEIHPLHGGANNRVFRIDVTGSQICLKAYFQHPDDPRDRLGAEFSFARFAWDKGVHALPKPLACDQRNRLALYEFISGHQLQPGEVTQDMVQQALGFYRDLNRHKDEPEAETLPKASESCFSITNHLQRVSNRVDRLLAVKDLSPINHEAIEFIRNDLSEVWRDVVKSVQWEARQLHLPIEKEIPRSDWCLSPSDFGFHNAILAADGRLRFIDLEYAGWDDPAKMVCDFFNQPAVPVSLDYCKMFVKTVIQDLSEPEMHRQRISLLLPVYRIKWCCILLNDFLPAGSARRRFARSGAEQEKQKTSQLQKARCALNSLTR
jgi:thiamine kinase-like enzyme